MTLEKAIEIKKRKGEELLNTSPAEIYEADRLSTEALKRLLKLREDNAPRANFILPGETQD